MTQAEVYKLDNVNNINVVLLICICLEEQSLGRNIFQNLFSKTKPNMSLFRKTLV